MKASRNALYGSLLLLPAAVLLWTFTYQPILGTIVDSLFSTARGKRAAVFVGLDQYHRMIDDPVFWKAIGNNLIYALTTIPLSMALALLMALLVNSHLRGQAAVRMAYFTPTILPMVAVANIWLFFYAPDYGLVDRFLQIFGWGGHNLLGMPDTALGALIVITIWKEAGFFMIFYLAALQQMSPALLEAAGLEGASYWQTLRRVITPAADADDSVRLDQCSDRRFPPGRSHRRDDQGRLRTTRRHSCFSTSTRSASATGIPRTPRR